MAATAPSLFSEVTDTESFRPNDLCFVILGSLPVSSGHVLVIMRRVVPTCFERIAAKQ